MRNRIPFKKDGWMKTEDGWTITFACPVVYHGDIPFLEVEASDKETVTLNGKVLIDHKEGLFHVPMDKVMKAADNQLTVTGNPAAVTILLVPKSHFYLHENGEPSLDCMTRSLPDEGTILVSGSIKDPVEGDGLRYTLYAADGLVCDQVEVDASNQDPVSLYTGKPVFWNGVRDSRMYYISAQLIRRGRIQDEVGIPCGLRSFSLDVQGRFLLNGTEYPLRMATVDERIGLESLKVMKEQGVTAIYHRAADSHPAFYTWCDYLGLIVLERIDPLSFHTSRVANHPSICLWVAPSGTDGETMQSLRMKDLTRLTISEDDIKNENGDVKISMKF